MESKGSPFFNFIYGNGGDLLYRWGNPEAYNQGSLNSQKLWGQHDVKWIQDSYPDEGKIMIFNNGSGTYGYDAREYSSIDIINPPTYGQGNYLLNENGTYGPSVLDWTFMTENPYDFYADYISGSDRLKNGNTIICNGPQGHFFEINPSGEIVWEYINPVTNSGILSQGEDVTDVQNPVFKCKRYTNDYPAFENINLNTNGFVELNPINDMCEIYDDISLIKDVNTNEKKIIKKIDILGRQSLNSNNNMIFNIYNDGTISKIIQF